MTQSIHGTRHITGRAAAFGGRVEALELEVELRGDNDPIVRVWDDEAESYTTCHSLSAEDQARFVEQARSGKIDSSNAATQLYHDSLGLR